MPASVTTLREVTRPDGIWLVEGEVVLSEVRSKPGATGSIPDVLAAAVAELGAGPRLGLLGFAAGGIVAPLRAMGIDHPVIAVDLAMEGERIFRRVSRYEVGDVRVERADAVAWLEARDEPFDVIVEDLSVPNGPDDVVKPEISYGCLPRLIARRLAPGGVAVFNLLPSPEEPWTELLPRVTKHFGRALLVSFPEYDNRFLFCGSALDSAAKVSRALRSRLRAIDSTALDWSLRTLR